MPPRAAATPAKYNADGSGRDTYIRRDPVECFGKNNYKTDPPVITRMGAAGSHVPRERGAKLGETDPVGGANGGGGFERPARFLRPKVQDYPVEITHFSTMKECVQDAFVTSGGGPGVSGYTGFKPRCPPAPVGSAEWATISSTSLAAPPAE